MFTNLCHCGVQNSTSTSSWAVMKFATPGGPDLGTGPSGLVIWDFLNPFRAIILRSAPNLFICGLSNDALFR
jgi:hypothetical protein